MLLYAGGIGDGRGWMAAHALGAEGIEMGTRFIATKECVHAAEVYKQALVDSSESDTTVIKRSLGAPARALRNEFTQTKHSNPHFIVGADAHIRPWDDAGIVPYGVI